VFSLPCLCGLSPKSFEIVAGARRYRAMQMAEAPTVPVHIVNLTDAAALEAQLIELSIVVKSFLCLHAYLARRLHAIDVPSLPQTARQNGKASSRALKCGRDTLSVHWLMPSSSIEFRRE
jgi:hypothetical protein